jgi:hypothetical protein
MPSSSARRTTRRLLKLASLGLAGLLAGLLAGCKASPSNSATVAPYPHISTDAEFTPATSPSSGSSDLPASLDARQIPALRHPPSARRLQYGAVRITGEPVLPNARTGS